MLRSQPQARAENRAATIVRHYPETIRPALQVINRRKGIQKVSGLYISVLNRKIYFLADATVNVAGSPFASRTFSRPCHCSVWPKSSTPPL